MKKTLFALLLSLVLIFSSCIPAFAAPAGGYIRDEECVFTETAMEELNSTAEEIENTYGVELIFAMDFSYTDATDLTNDTYAAVGSPEKAVILSVTEEYYHIGMTSGLDTVFTDDVQDAMRNAYATADTYYDGVMGFMQAAESALMNASYGDGEPVISKAPLLIDDQDILSDAEELILSSELETAGAECGADIVILTTDELDEYNDQSFCDNYYDYNGYGQGTERNGLLFAFDANDPGGALFYVSTRGSAMAVISDYVIDEIIDVIRYDLKGGNYLSAFVEFAEQCRYYYSEAENGNYYDDPGYYDDYGYDYDYTPTRESYSSKAPKYALISIVVGLIAALIVVSSMKGKLKSVHKQYDAANYVRNGSMYLTDNRDTFLYNRITSTPKPQQTSSGGARSGGGGGHVSSSGASHGGHGGRL